MEIYDSLVNSLVGVDLELLIGGGSALLAGLGYLLFRKRPKVPSAYRETPAPGKEETAEAPQTRTPDSATPESSATAPPPESPAVEAKAPTAPSPERSQYRTLEDALSKTKDSFWGRVASKFSGKSSISNQEIEDLEEILYTSDLGPKTVDVLIKNVTAKLDANGDSNIQFLQRSLKEELQSIFTDIEEDKKSLKFEGQPAVWMVVGVNGAGKTTTIGKLASQQVAQGKRVLIAAGDTFRAAADAQLKVWADRAAVEIFSPENVKDPSAVAFDALQKAKAKNFDLVIIDTAGRLHTQKNLMEELKKMKRVMNKAIEGSPCETLLVLDANSGQNALMQAAQFHEAVGVTGVILTKMDGSAKGGVAVGIACEHQLPIKMIGVGEKIEDLRPFHSQDFVDSII